jgi:hypothetical protein
VALGSMTMSNCLVMLTNGAMSTRLLGVVGLLLMGVLWVVIFLVLKRANSDANQLRTSADPPKKIRASIRRLQVAVVALPVLLVAGLWMTRGEPLVPRITGAAVNVFFTLWFISLIRRAKKQLP